MNKRSYLIGMALCLIVVLALVPWSFVWRVQDPDSAMSMFLSHQGASAEEQLIDPLIVSGKQVVPRVIAHLRSDDDRMRPYAAVFLGNGGYTEGLPILLKVVADADEHSQTRGYALASIYRLDPIEGSRIATGYSDDGGTLGVIAGQIAAHQDPGVFRRTILAALWRWKW